MVAWLQGSHLLPSPKQHVRVACKPRHLQLRQALAWNPPRLSLLGQVHATTTGLEANHLPTSQVERGQDLRVGAELADSVPAADWIEGCNQGHLTTARARLLGLPDTRAASPAYNCDSAGGERPPDTSPARPGPLSGGWRRVVPAKET